MSAPRPPRESSTVVLTRDGQAGLEVLMLRRNLNSDFIGGAYVFPGGSLDATDCDDILVRHYGGLSPLLAGKRLDLDPMRAIGHWGCAVRETFEEAGVLLASQDGALVPLDSPEAQSHWAERRRQLLDGELAWPELVAAEGLTLALEQLAYFAHWITPEGSPKRFSTRFFVARIPEGQTPLPDQREVDAGEWLRPSDALERHGRGELPMIFPTIKTLEEIASFTSSRALMQACHGRLVVTRLPRIVQRDGDNVILLPGDPGYDEAGGPPKSFDPWRL